MTKKLVHTKFACGRFNIEDMVACSLSLKKSEYKIFEVLLKDCEQMTIQDISEKLSLDRTTVQKVLKNLVSKGLVQRFQKNLENGGYVFAYAIKDKEAVKKHIMNMLTEWYNQALNNIKTC